VGFEHTNPVLERAKTLHALYRATTMIGIVKYYGNGNDTGRVGVIKSYIAEMGNVYKIFVRNSQINQTAYLG
jgi:hypothetical protein